MRPGARTLGRGGSSAGAGFSRLFFCVYLAPQLFSFPDDIRVQESATGADLTTALLNREAVGTFFRTDLAPQKWLQHVQQLYGLKLKWEHTQSDEECKTLADMWSRAWWDGKVGSLDDTIHDHMENANLVFRFGVTISQLFRVKTPLRDVLDRTLRFSTEGTCDGNTYRFSNDEKLTYEVPSKLYSRMKLSLVFRRLDAAPISEYGLEGDVQPMQCEALPDFGELPDMDNLDMSDGTLLSDAHLRPEDFDYNDCNKAVRIAGANQVFFIVPAPKEKKIRRFVHQKIYHSGSAVCRITFASEAEAVLAATQIYRHYFHIKGGGPRTAELVSERVLGAAGHYFAKGQFKRSLLSESDLAKTLMGESWCKCPFIVRACEILNIDSPAARAAIRRAEKEDDNEDVVVEQPGSAKRPRVEEDEDDIVVDLDEE